MGQGCLTEVKVCGNFGKKSQTSAGHTHTSCDKIGDWTVVQLSGAMWRAHGHGPIKDAVRRREEFQVILECNYPYLSSQQ